MYNHLTPSIRCGVNQDLHPPSYSTCQDINGALSVPSSLTIKYDNPSTSAINAVISEPGAQNSVSSKNESYQNLDNPIPSTSGMANPSSSQRPTTSCTPKFIAIDDHKVSSSYVKSAEDILNCQHEYAKNEYSYTMINGETCPKCKFCHRVFTKNQITPLNLSRHIRYHKKRLAKGNNASKTNANSSNDGVIPKKYWDASLEISYLMALNKMPDNIAQMILLPAATKIAEKLFSKESAEKLKLIDLSKKNIASNIDIIADDIRLQMMEKILWCKYFAIQVDGILNNSTGNQLIVLIRFFFEKTLHEELLFCKPVSPKCSSGRDIFLVIDSYFQKHNIPWMKCVSLSHDLAPFYDEFSSSLRNAIEEKAQHVRIHCCNINKRGIVMQHLDPEIYVVFESVIEAINILKMLPPSSNIHRVIYNEIGRNHRFLLRHTESRWLSYGSILSKIAQIHADIANYFLTSGNFRYFHNFSNDEWLATVAYLADLMDLINHLDQSLEENGSFLVMCMKLVEFKENLIALKRKIQQGNLKVFPCLSTSVGENRQLAKRMQILVYNNLKHIEELMFKIIISNFDTDNEWVMRPFMNNVKTSHLSNVAKEQLLEMKKTTAVRFILHPERAATWWLKVQDAYPELAMAAESELVPFGSRKFCEETFSAMTIISYMNSRKIDIDSDVRIAVTKNIKPRLLKEDNDENY